VLVIASALSLQDVRDRPMEAQQQADQQHAKFDDEKSEFSGYLTLWNWLQQARGGTPPTLASARVQKDQARKKAPNQAFLPVAQRASGAQPQPAPPSALADAAPSHKLSNRQYEQLLRQNFINVRRVREWRDVHSQLLTVVAEHKWELNPKPASYEELHNSMLAGLLGNIGFKPEEEDVYLGARGIKFHRHPGAHLRKKPGRWIVCAELVETTRLFGRGIANIDPTWLEEVGGHLLKKQLLDPHWEKKAAEVVAFERATLYGLVVYSGRRKPFDKVDPQAAREMFIRQALVAGDVLPEWHKRLPFLAANEKLIAKVEELEHKSRRQDVLVDEELIYAFYDQQLPQDITSGRSFEQWYRQETVKRPELLLLTRDELMRHEAAGITTAAFPKMIRLGGVDCQASYLHEPGDARDGVTVAVPLFVLNQVSEERCEWLVPGMLKEKIQALLKSLPQRPRSRFVPLPESAARLAELLGTPDRIGHLGLVDALLKQVRDETSLDVKRADFKLDMLSPHLFMNFRIVDEHGRQLGQGRNLGALKAEWGAKARGAFQALAGLKLSSNAQEAKKLESNEPLALTGQAQAAIKTKAKSALPTVHAEARYTSWTFGELPELMEIGRGGQQLIGFPALIDAGDAVTIEVFDEPDVAAAKHRAGLRRLFALQIKDALKYLEKNLPELQKMAVAFMPLGTQEELRSQILDVAMGRAFLLEPLPTNAQEFDRRVQEGRGRLTLIANEVARLAATILAEYALAARKIKDTKNAPEATQDALAQLQRLVPKNFLTAAPWPQLAHFARYLKAITARLDKLRADPARDAAKLAELRPQEQRYWRLVAERKGAVDARMQELRWLLEELRVSFFAQELRTPQPVSVKRLDKLWAQIQS